MKTLNDMKRFNQKANGSAFVGAATAVKGRSGAQYLIVAPDMASLEAAFSDVCGEKLNKLIVKNVFVFERKTP